MTLYRGGLFMENQKSVTKYSQFHISVHWFGWSAEIVFIWVKKGDRSPACNYRPVSLTCVPCKLLEHIVCSNIMAHLDEHIPLSEKQHAFRKWHSCETQLITVIDDWAKLLDNQGQVDTFILDFEKAFDTPPPPPPPS